jgi:DNA-binding CsgD family transcriptional regulator/tetratricopeptide (TPR) repeat protein
MGHYLPLRFPGVATLETPFVGHAALFEELRAMLVRTEGSAGRPSVILGGAGHGKSRLLRELAALWPPSAYVVALRCEADAPFGRTVLAEQLRIALDGSGPRRFAGETADPLEARLRAVAARRPLLCLVDDLHLAHREELDLFEALTNECRHARLALVGTCSSEPRASTAAASRIRAWNRSGTQSFALGPLDRSAAELLLRNVLAARRRSIDRAAKEAMLDVASGNPRYIAELVDELCADAAGAPPYVPASARDKVTELRLVVSEAAFEVLRAVSVFGHPFEDEWVARLGSEHRPDALANALQEGVDAGILYELRGRDAFDFREPALRFALYVALVTPVRRRTHARIAEVLTSVRVDPENDALIARHWIEAGRPDAAIEWLGHAASFEAGRSRYREAIELDRYAAALVSHDSGAHWEIQSRLAHSLAALGDFKEAAGVRRELALHLLAAGRLEEAHEQLFNLMHDYWYDGTPQLARPIYRKLQRCVRNEELRGRIELGWADICAVGGYRNEASRVVTALRITDQSSAELRTTHLRQAALLGSRERPVARTMSMFERAMSIAHDAGLHRDEVYVAMTAANTAAELAELTIAETWMARSDALLAARPELVTGTTALAALVHCELSVMSGALGRARDALTAYRFAERLGTYWESCFCGFAVFIGQRLGDASWVNAYFRPGLLDSVLHSRQIEGVAIALRGFSETLLERGMQESLQGVLHTSVAQGFVDPYFWIQLQCARYGRADDLEAARRQIDASVGQCNDTVARAALALFDALVARRTNTARTARQAGLAAAEMYHAMQWPWVEALALETAGERTEASVIYAACGALRDVERISGRTRKARRAAFGSALTPREEQIATLVGQGMTNREIARRLRRSERTINHHVEAIFSKQGIRARWQLSRRPVQE